MNKDTSRFCTGRISRTAIALLVVWTTIDPVFAQDTQAPSQQAPIPQAPSPQPPAPAQTKVYSLTDLEYLLGPIALYPDPLLTLVLTASAFPLQIVQADRWIVDNSDAVKQNDFTKVDSMPWDSSVQALTRFPDVVQMLSDHLDWTESLGTAFSSQPEDVANVIQMLRAKAESVGNLKSTPEQEVTTREEGGSRVIFIAPTNPERIYVPVYDSSVVFTNALTGALIFGTGVLVGSSWNNRWGWNNRRWNQVWINPPVWQPPPPNWRPPLRPGARPPGVWRPDRPGGRPAVRPERPSAGRPADQRRRPAGSQQRRHAGSQQRPRPQQTNRPPQRQQGGARPQQRARPQQQARPGQHHTRPRQGGGGGSSQRPQRPRPQPGATPQ